MGTWGTGLYSNDSACDIRGDYIDKLKRGKTNVNTKKATAKSKKYTESEKNKRSEDGGLNNRKAESPV